MNNVAVKLPPVACMATSGDSVSARKISRRTLKNMKMTRWRLLEYRGSEKASLVGEMRLMKKKKRDSGQRLP